MQLIADHSLSHVRFLATPWTAARQASLSFTMSQSLFQLMSIESVVPSDHLVLCRPLLLLPSVFPQIRVFSNELALHIRQPKYCSFNFSLSPSNEFSFTFHLGSPVINFLSYLLSLCQDLHTHTHSDKG